MGPPGLGGEVPTEQLPKYYYSVLTLPPSPQEILRRERYTGSGSTR